MIGLQDRFFGVIKPRRRGLPHSVLARRLSKQEQNAQLGVKQAEAVRETATSGLSQRKSFSFALYKIGLQDRGVHAQPARACPLRGQKAMHS